MKEDKLCGIVRGLSGLVVFKNNCFVFFGCNTGTSADVSKLQLPRFCFSQGRKEKELIWAAIALMKSRQIRSEKAVRKLQRKPVLFWNLKISFIIRQFVPLEQNIKKYKFCLYSPPQYFIGNADQIIKTFSLDLKSWESTLLTV